MNTPNRITIRLTVDSDVDVNVDLTYSEWKQKYALAHTLPEFNKLSTEGQEKVYKAEWMMLNEEIPGAILESDYDEVEVIEDAIREVLEMEDFLPQVKDFMKEML